jgi:ABC-type branched-subunit amino acid transport system ATPase component/ABC-type branched-subunit amino acid transport system permease subunit
VNSAAGGRGWGAGRTRAAYGAAVLLGLWLVLDFALPHLVTTSQTSSGHWQTPLPSVVLGLITGSTYGLLAVGLVLIYRSNRIINFAHGEIGAFAASFFGIEVVRWHLPYWVALWPALALAALVGMAIEAVVVRRLVTAPLVMSVVATLAAGQFLALFALVINSQANASLIFPQPPGLPSFEFGALLITPADTAMIILAPAAVLGVGLFLKRTRYGRGIRSAAANPDAARMAGIPVKRMSSITWAIAGALVALSAILTQATVGFSSGDQFGPQLLLVALTGAVLGRMRSLPGALLGGLAVGVTQQLLLWNSPDSGLVEWVLFIGIVVALLVQRRPVGRGEDKGAWSTTSGSRPLPDSVRSLPSIQVLERAPWVLLLIALAAVPLAVSNATSIHLTISFGFVVVALSVGVVTGLGGQLSLGQFAVAAIGAYASYEVSRTTGNFLLSFASAGLAGAAACATLGIPAIRARGLMFTVTTLAFALVVPNYLLSRSWLLGDGRDPGRPIVFGRALTSGHSYYYVGLLTMVFALWFARNVRSGGLGRRLIAVRDNEDAARAFTIGATAAKIQGYALAGFLAGLGGAVYGHALSQIGVDGFPAAASITVVKIAVIGGLSAVSGPLFGAVLVQGVDYVSLGSLALALVTLAQLGVILALPGGVVQLAVAARDRIAGRLARRQGVDLAAAAVAERGMVDAAFDAGQALPDVRATRPHRPPIDGLLLEVADLHKSFAGIQAVRGMDLTVQAGETVGLIGPNGAGKTTTFELVAGFVRADRGTVRYRGNDVTRLSPQARGRLGMIRSFQDAALFPTLTVAACVALALERSDPTAVARSFLGLSRSDRSKRAGADQLLEYLGLRQYRAAQVHELSTGTRRLVEIGCLVALAPELLLLDEPSSGLAQQETDALAVLLAHLGADGGASMVIIEHDIPLVMGVSDRVVCMADGAAIASGPPAQIQADPRVIEAYLGVSTA